MIQSTTLQFLTSLKKNNNKEWFEKNRLKYENAKENFIDLTAKVLHDLGAVEKSITHLEPKKCIFRINRDVRFSKDKSPYKTNMGMSISKGGRSGIYAGYYFHLEPGQSFIGGGLYMPSAEILKNVRQEIDYNWKEFEKIITTKKFVSTFNSLNKSKEFSLTRPPKGYDETNPALEYIKLKSWIAGTQLSSAEVQEKNLAKKIVSTFETIKPLIDFLNRGIEA